MDSLPTKVGQRERCIFELARRLYSIHGDAIKQHFDTQQIIFNDWWSKAREIVSTKDYETSLQAFLRAIERVNTPLEDLVRNAFDNASIPIWAEMMSAPCGRLAGACIELQRLSGDKPFFLSCRTAASLLDVSHVQSAKWLILFRSLHCLSLFPLAIAKLGWHPLIDTLAQI